MKHLIKLHNAALELTLACPCKCETCGSSAGKKRSTELDLKEWKAVISSLNELGCKRISLLGGEPLLFKDWPELVSHISSKAIAVEMITSGIGLTKEVAKTMKEVKLSSVTLSVDGIENIHDEQRKVKGGFKQAIEGIKLACGAGIKTGATTQINTQTLPVLQETASVLEKAGVLGWQVQLTIPKGRAKKSHLALSPGDMPKVLAEIRKLITRPGLRPYITDNIGYMTKDDPILRTPPRIMSRCWLGCFAGIRTLGIMSDGSVKGCLALPDDMVEGNLQSEPLVNIWKDLSRFSYTRSFEISKLAGNCAVCQYGPVCRGGCTAVSLSVHGIPHISSHCFRLF